MAIAKAKTVSVFGMQGSLVEVEVDVADGLPGYILLGLPDISLSESRERVRSAMINSHESWPNRKVVVSLTPAWLPKSGPSFDLPIAIALLQAQALIPILDDSTVFMGELGLDGQIKSIRGLLPALLAAKSLGIRRAIIPASNYSEALLVNDLQIIPSLDLKSVADYLRTGNKPLREFDERGQGSHAANYEGTVVDVDFADVAGQDSAKFALEVSAVGGHHALLIGPPGTGKTMLAQRVPGIMPELTDDELLEVKSIHSVAGLLQNNSHHSHQPPFIAPHHGSSSVAMIGGGSHYIKPGSCSLAHYGVLFIDEAPECATGVLDALRQPLESGSVTISRAMGSATFPAQFILILAANPCPCGRFSGRGKACTCSAVQLRRYTQRLSGPLLDRIDIRSFVSAPTRIELSNERVGESSSVIRKRVASARLVARQRFANLPWSVNSKIPAQFLRTDFSAERAGMALLHQELDRERLSARGMHRTLRVAWSIADLSEHPRPTVEDVQRAIELREGLEDR